jgi:hypothetical protein
MKNTSITELIKDPAWWFTAVLIALIVGILSSTVTNMFPKWFSRYKNSLKQYKHSRRNNKQLRKHLLNQAAEELIENPLFYTSGFLRIILDILILKFVVILSLAIGPLECFYKNNPSYDPTRSLYDGIFPEYMTGVIGIIGCLIAGIKSYRLMTRLTLINAAHKKMRLITQKSFSLRLDKLQKTDSAKQDAAPNRSPRIDSEETGDGSGI